MEFTSVYIEKVGENYDKQKGESLMLLDKSKDGIMIKQHKMEGDILFLNTMLNELIEKCQVKPQDKDLDSYYQ